MASLCHNYINVDVETKTAIRQRLDVLKHVSIKIDHVSSSVKKLFTSDI